MTGKASRDRVVLAVIAIVSTVGVVVWRGGILSGSPAAVPASRAQAAAPSSVKTALVADVQLERLRADQRELDPATRNPFRFQQRAAPARPASTRPTTAPGGAAPVVAVAVAPVPPPGPPPLPPIALKYIGVLETAQGRRAVFRGTGGEIVNGSEGDIVDGRYRLLKIGAESADLAYADGRGQQTIRLSGQ